MRRIPCHHSRGRAPTRRRPDSRVSRVNRVSIVGRQPNPRLKLVLSPSSNLSQVPAQAQAQAQARPCSLSSPGASQRPAVSAVLSPVFSLTYVGRTYLPGAARCVATCTRSAGKRTLRRRNAAAWSARGVRSRDDASGCAQGATYMPAVLACLTCLPYLPASLACLTCLPYVPAVCASLTLM